MNYKDLLKKILVENLINEAEFQGMEDGIPVFTPSPTPSNPSPKPIYPQQGPVPANPNRPNRPQLPPGTPPQPPAPRDPNGNPLPGAFGLVPIRMPDGSLRYEWVWTIPGGGILLWHPDGRWVKPPSNPLRPGGIGTIA